MKTNKTLRTWLAASFLLLAVPHGMAQTNWEKVEKLLNDGSPKSAYSQAETVFKKTTSSPDLLTAAWYMARAAAQYQEDCFESSEARFRQILPRLEAPERAVCYAFLGESDSALLDEELLKKTSSDRISRFCWKVNDKDLKGVNLTPTAFDVVALSILSDEPGKRALLQKLIDFHKNDNDYIRISLDLRMLDMQDDRPNETPLKKCLQDYINKYRGSSSPLLTQFYYRMASYLSNRNYKEEAVRYCDTAITLFPKSQGGADCADLRNLICRATIGFYALNGQGTVYPGRPSLQRLTYNNLSHIHFALYSYSRANQYGEINEFLQHPTAPLHKWNLDVEDDGSHIERALVFDLPALASGCYILVASQDNKFDEKDAYIAIQCFDFAICYTNDGEYLMTDAVTGAPIEGQDVIFVDYNGNPVDTATTHPDGRFLVFRNPNIRKMRIERGGTFEDFCWVPRQSSYRNHDRSLFRAHTISDRPIYRPGDTLHFASLIYKSDGFRGNVVPGRDATVFLQDPNGQSHEKRELSADEHGMVSTLFVIPANAMAGEWDVRLESGTVSNWHSFRVEEYKQPKFMVSIERAKEAPSFGQPYILRGLAQAYSGVNISDAKVKYTIERAVYWRRWFDGSQTSYWSIGDSTVTAADGSFEISFIPQPDSTLDFSLKPSFLYTIHVEVTDLNGETHEASSDIIVGFVNEDIRIGDKFFIDDEKTSVRYIYGDLNGNPLEGDVQIKIERLRLPDTLRLLPAILKNQFDEKTVMSLSSDEFHRLFPYYAYSERELEYPSVDWHHIVSHHSDGSKRAYDVDLGVKKLPSGVYRLIAIAGEITDTQYVTLVLPHERTLPTADLVWTEMPNKVEVGTTCTVRYASAFDGTRVFYLLTGPDGEKIDSRWLTADRRIRTLSIPVDSSMLGGFKVHLVTIREGVKYQMSKTVTVPFSHKKLNVDIATFRDKLQPGEQEEWTIRVESGKLKVDSSTLIMTMYDDALDSYRRINNWSFNPWRSTIYQGLFWVDFDGEHGYYWQPFEHVSYDNPATYNFLLASGFSDGLDDDKEICFEVVVVEEEEASPGRILQRDVRKRASVNTAAVEGIAISYEKAADVADMTVDTEKQPDIPLRSNLSTLAFFVADLHTDSTGTATYRFRVPDLLTRWKIKGLAFTDDLKIGTFDKTLVTQRSLMVQPNIPRFLRQGDSIVMMAKVMNLTDTARKVRVMFTLNNPNTPNNPNNLITKIYQVVNVPAQGSKQVTFPFHNLPRDLYVATYEITAQTCDEHGPQYSDGERGQIPVLPNRQAVTLSQPIYINGAGEKTFNFQFSTLNSPTAKPQFLGAELVSNPAWLAIKAMPYLNDMENPSNLFLANRLYVNTLASSILQDFKGLKDISALCDTSNTRLKINADIKQTLIESTPWLRDAESEMEQRKAIANYFDSSRMTEEFSTLTSQLSMRQNDDGGWSWIHGGESSLWVTRQILKRLVTLKSEPITENALAYVDREEKLNYDKYVKPHLKKDYQWAPDNIDYLYTRSFYGKGCTEAYKFYYKNALKNYKQYNNLYTQAQLALVFHRHGDRKAARDIIRRLKEKCLESDEMGMYWRDNRSGWFWYERPVETQALLIQAFSEVTPRDTAAIALMQQWLLKQKQATHWGNDRATVEAIKALTLSGNTVDTSNAEPTLTVCGMPLSNPSEGLEGYRSQRWTNASLDSVIALGDSTVTIRKETPGIAWGAVYFQYTDDMDKVPSTESGISIRRTYLCAGNWKVGDRVKVRIEISCDRTMEYLELIDGRPSCVEPVSTRSGWMWNQGLRYYVEVKNSATHCYINRLEKGDYVVEYDAFVTNPGTFLAPPSVIQCLYAPEFRATSPASRLAVQK